MKPGQEWWRGAVIYQIYPRSFADSNNDGLGDLRGITAKLDYVASLGVDGIWISPFFKSPMVDYGYDVSDYCDVDPMFGTLDDFDALVARAHELGLKVVIDQVYSHTSNRHPWFEESRQSRDNPKADWYVWADAKQDGSPPNNWQAIFHGPAWEFDVARGQYYMHNFLVEQPDLNLHNPQVQDALLNVARFWLDRGVDGFRLDAINCGMHDTLLRDNPVAKPPWRSEVRPHFMQEPKYSVSHDDMPQVLERLRVITNGYGEIMTVAEIGAPEPLPFMKQYTQGGKRLNTAYSFDFLSAKALTPELVERVVGGWPGEHDEGWPSWAFSNHDAPRVVSRWLTDCPLDRRARLLALLQFSLRGNVFLYQGEELGLPQANVPYECLRDPEGIKNWPHSMGRDGARTPMPWTGGTQAGFSDAEPWLPIDPIHAELAVSVQNDDEASVLNFFRQLLGLRRESDVLRRGSQIFLDAPDDVIAFRRDLDGAAIVCVLNIGHQIVDWAPPGIARGDMLATVGETGDALDAYSGYIAELA
jgi:alpha-glucosidase